MGIIFGAIFAILIYLFFLNVWKAIQDVRCGNYLTLMFFLRILGILFIHPLGCFMGPFPLKKESNIVKNFNLYSEKYKDAETETIKENTVDTKEFSLGKWVI